MSDFKAYNKFKLFQKEILIINKEIHSLIL